MALALVVFIFSILYTWGYLINFIKNGDIDGECGYFVLGLALSNWA